jgi:hypothetical protein
MGTDVLSADRQFDVHVVSIDVLSTTGLPESLPRSSIWVSGTVQERVAGGLRPVTGAVVTLEDVDGLSYRAVATTVSDSQGRYLVCTSPPGTGTDVLAYVSARKDGFELRRRDVFLGWDYADIDLELTRK